MAGIELDSRPFFAGERLERYERIRFNGEYKDRGLVVSAWYGFDPDWEFDHLEEKVLALVSLE